MAGSRIDPPVRSFIEGDVGRIVLNRPWVLNALDGEMLQTIWHVLDRWQHDSAVATVLIDGEGERGLCAGGDVRALYEMLVSDGGVDDAETYFHLEYGVDRAIVRYAKPIVVIGDGVTMGGGIGLLGGGDVRVVTETSRLAMPETRLGFSPDAGGSWLLAHAPGRMGEYLALTSTTVGASDAIYAGLADHLIPRAHLPSFRAALVERADPSTATELAWLFDETPDPGPVQRAAGWIDEAFSAATVTEIRRRLIRLVESGIGAAPSDAASAPHASDAEISPAAALAAIDERSPTALVVALAAVRQARTLDDRTAGFEQELHLMQWFLHHQSDVVEGIRAQVVDKDHAPRWHPPTLAEVAPDIGAEALAYRGSRTLNDGSADLSA